MFSSSYNLFEPYTSSIFLRVKKPCYLVIAGHSMSGKTFLCNSLLEVYPYLFSKATQITTRPMRENEKQYEPYMFVDDRYFDLVEKDLVGVVKNPPFFYRYGTVNTIEKNKVNIIILSEEGLKDLKNKTNTKIVTIGIVNGITRKEREKILLEEMKVLEICDKVFNNFIEDEQIKFVEPLEVVSYLLSIGVLENA